MLGGGGGVRLFVGGDAQNVQRRRFDLTGDRFFSAAGGGPRSRFTPDEAAQVVGGLDSGAFSDAPEGRLTSEQALVRQLEWEGRAERFWGYPWRAEAVVSYDLLIDEKWCGGKRKKQRWGVREADHAVRVTVDAAAFLASRRAELAPRKLILACQGVDHRQYLTCLEGILGVTKPEDRIGLGGWCILGRNRKWLPTFWRAIRLCLPPIASAGIRQVHVFGVTYRPALGGLLWLAHQYGLSVSTDSSGPVLATTWKDQKKAGAVFPRWEDNVAHWKNELASLARTEFYREPPAPHGMRQMALF